MSGSWPPIVFPGLHTQDYNCTSPSSIAYNCIAWAADDTSAWWWPDDHSIGYGYWPSNVPREETIEAFVAAYATLGYERCASSSDEQGFERIALYALPDGSPTHAARRLPDGFWTSQLGIFEDITHATLACLDGPTYGRAVVFLRRPRRLP